MNKVEKELEKKQKELEEAIKDYNDYDDEDTKRTNQLFNRCRILESYINGLKFALEYMEEK